MNAYDNGHREPSYISPDILHLIKTGNAPFAESYIKELRRPDYPLDFVVFMDQMIQESGLDRKTVIARSGLSESLAYKYLNGNKTTNERDYILALCIAMHLNVPKTQHALRCCGMPLLSWYDPRATLIIWGIEKGADRYEIDEYLEKAGFPPIKISSDMKSAVIADSMYMDPNLSVPMNPVPALQALPQSPASVSPVPAPRQQECTVMDSSASAAHCGNAPFDFNYFGSMLLKDDEGNNIHLEITYLVTGESFFLVLNDEQYAEYKEGKKELEGFDIDALPTLPSSEEDDKKLIQELLSAMEGLEAIEASDVSDEEIDPLESREFDPGFDCLEAYDSLLAATASEYFSYFMDLDHLIDKKVAETVQFTDDTRNFNFRIGAHWAGSNKPEIYIELFNATRPERREYYQLIENIDHECRYTASHESYYMQIELGDIYDVYYPKRRDPEYFLQATDQDFSDLDKHYQMIFNTLRHYLHVYARSEKTLIEIPDDQFYDEESEFFAEQYIVAMHAEDYEQARNMLHDLETVVEESNFPAAKKLVLLTINDWRLYQVAVQLGEADEAAHRRDRIVSRKEEVLKLESELGDDRSLVFTSIADVLLNDWRAGLCEEKGPRPLERLEELLELMKHGAFSDEENESRERFEVYQAYAFRIDGKDPEEAEVYYQRALREATRHHLDLNRFAAAAVAAVYNNYAWLLWNAFGNEEAIMYYGRAIELTENYLDNGMLSPDHARKDLAHYGAALLKIYEATSRQKEKKRLLRRLQNSGVAPEE